MDYVKICGLKQHEEVQFCIDNGADAVGFIYNVPTSPRNLQKSELQEILTKIGTQILTVVVFKPSSILKLQETMKEVQSSYYQIHIGFHIKELENLSEEQKKMLIIALKVNQDNKQSVIEQINKYHNQFFAFLIDNSEGQGNELDIEIVKEVLKETGEAKVIVAGGINTENVKKIVNTLNPYGIDASSSLESEMGVKDIAKIKQFLKIIKEL